MPTSTRDILLIMRARDQASAVIRSLGGQFQNVDAAIQATALNSIGLGAVLAAVGVGLYSVGKKGLDFFLDARDAASEYQQSAALTLTQVDSLGVSLDQIKDIGRDVAKAIPAPFEQMQASLYDIFSSMDVNVNDAQKLLTEFSKASVAGQTDVQTAGRATIAIMNGFKIPVEEVNRVLDVQFESVRKGVMTYEEFATSIGRAIPSAQRAGQSVETLASMMAFLTRNGLSADMAATSSARAFDLLSNPKFADRMHKFGIEVFDASGQFRPMLDVATELRNRLALMTPEKRTEELADLTRGAGGTIQAMRFLNLAVNDSNGLFGSLSESITNSTGSMDAAYNIMFAQPATQSQLFANNVAILKTEIGDVLLPSLVELTKVGIKVLQWFEDMDPHTKKIIVTVGVLASILLMVVGVVLTVVGGFMILSGVLSLLGLSFSAILIPVLIVIAVIAALAAVGYLIYRNWGTIKDIAGEVWHYVLTAWNAIRDGVVAAAQFAWDKLKAFWHWVQDTFSTIFNASRDIVASAMEAIANAVSAAWQWIVDAVTGGNLQEIFQTIVKEAGDIFDELIQTFDSVSGYISFWASFIWDIIKVYVALWWAEIQIAVDLITVIITVALDIIIGIWTAVWPLLSSILSVAWAIIVEVVQAGVLIIQTVISVFVAIITFLWEAFGSTLWNVIKIAWDLIASIVIAAIEIISNIIQFFLNLIQGDWGEAWQNIKNIFAAAWDAIWAALVAVWRLIKEFFTNFAPNVLSAIGNLASTLLQKGKDLLQGLFDGIANIWFAIYNWFVGLPGYVLNGIGDLLSTLYNAGKDLMSGLLSGIKDGFSAVGDFLGGIADASGAIKGPPAYDKVVLVRNGQLMMQGFRKGLQDEWTNTEKWLGGLTSDISTSVGADANFGTASLGTGTSNTTIVFEEGAFKFEGVTDPEAVADAVEDKMDELIRELTGKGVQ